MYVPGRFNLLAYPSLCNAFRESIFGLLGRGMLRSSSPRRALLGFSLEECSHSLPLDNLCAFEVLARGVLRLSPPQIACLGVSLEERFDSRLTGEHFWTYRSRIASIFPSQDKQMAVTKIVDGVGTFATDCYLIRIGWRENSRGIDKSLDFPHVARRQPVASDSAGVSTSPLLNESNPIVNSRAAGRASWPASCRWPQTSVQNTLPSGLMMPPLGPPQHAGKRGSPS